MRKHLRKHFIPSEENNYTPHFFRETSVVLVTVISIALFSLSLVGTIVVNNTNLLGAIYSSVLVDLANQSRLDNNRSTLVISPVLEEAAKLKAGDMAEKSYFAHTSPDGKTPWYWISQAGYLFIYAGENLAVDFQYSKDVNDAWLNSPGHRANILNDKFTEIGIATSEGIYNGRSTVFVVEMFGTPSVPVPAPAVAGAASKPVPEPKKVTVVEEKTEGKQTFVAVSNDEAVQESPIQVTEKPEVLPGEAPGYEKYSTWYERLLLDPSGSIQYVFYALALIVLFALVLMIFINIQTQRPRHIAYGIVLLVIISGLMYLNSSQALASVVMSILS